MDTMIATTEYVSGHVECFPVSEEGLATTRKATVEPSGNQFTVIATEHERCGPRWKCTRTVRSGHLDKPAARAAAMVWCRDGVLPASAVMPPVRVVVLERSAP